MRTLWVASLNHLWQRPAQLALAFAGLALGVATITAVDIATASANKAFELSMDAVNGAITHHITGGPNGIDEQFYRQLRLGEGPAQIGPIEVTPIVEGYVAVGETAMQLLGIDAFADTRARGIDPAGVDRSAESTIDLQAWFTEPGTVVMSRDAAQQLGIAAGRSFTLQIGGHSHSARLLAELATTIPGSETLIFTDIAQAQEWLGSIGRLSRIDLRVPSGRSAQLVLKRLHASLPSGLQLREAPRLARENLEMTRAFTINLQAMSLLALLVSAFLIYSAISFAVVQRRRIFGVLRALGATRGNVLALVVAETLALGLIGSALGVLVGAAIGRQLIALVSQTINDLYFVVAVREVVLPSSTIVKATLAGIGVALLAAILPALEVANSAPQLGLRRSALESRARLAARGLSGFGLLCVVASGATVLISQSSLLAGFAALFLLLIGVAAFTPAVLRVLATAAARLAGRGSSMTRMAFSEIAASLSRTGVAVAALGVAVAAMLGVAIMVESFRESLRDWLDRTVTADFYVSAPGPGFARPERRLNPQVIQALLSVPGIAQHTASRRVSINSAHGPITIDALQPTAKASASIDLTQGNVADLWPSLKAGSIVISEPLAWRSGLSLGDSLTLDTAAGSRAFSIAGVYREYGNDRGTVLMSRSIYSRLWRDEGITGLGLYLADDVDSHEVGAALRAAAVNVPASARQALNIRSNAELRALSMRIFERTFVITRVLYWLAAGVAAIGLISALLAWELERLRELAVLRALGLTPRGTALLVEAQTAFMGSAALLAAIPAGLLAAVLLIEVINRRAFGWQIELHLNFAQFADALLLALAAALVAGLYPAWRGARVSVVNGIREE